MALIAVEIGGTKLQAALGDRDGTIRETLRGDARGKSEAQEILAWFSESVPKLMDAATVAGERVTEIGVGFGGPIDTASGRTLLSHQVGGWSDFALRAWFEDQFSLPAIVANDSSAACWGEFNKGVGEGARNFCYMNIGSGIGGGLVINGQLLDGQGIGAAEIGHMQIADDTVPTQGASARLEDLCSGWAIERRVRSAKNFPEDGPLYDLCGGEQANATCAMLASAAEAGDKFALHEIKSVATHIGLAIANVITLTHVERVALGGGVSMMGEILLEPLRRAVDEFVFAPYRGRYDIVPCALSESVVLVGMLLLAGASK